MGPLSFEYLVKRFGEIAAWYYLAEIERGAGIRPQYLIPDPEARLSYACQLQQMRNAMMADAEAA